MYLTVGQRIKSFREGNKFSVTDFAHLLKISERNIYNYESDKTSPHMSFWESLFTVFEDLNPKWMLTGQGQMMLTDAEPQVRESITSYLKKEELTDIILLIQKVRSLEDKIKGLEQDVFRLKNDLD